MCREDADVARRLQTRLEKTQQTAADANAAVRKSEHECASLQKQSTQLRERIKEVEHKQKVAPSLSVVDDRADYSIVLMPVKCFGILERNFEHS